MSSLKPSLGGFVMPITPSVTTLGREHLIRAAIENLCFAFKANLLQLEEVWRLKVEDVSIGGGVAQSPCLVQMLSDVLGLPVRSFGLPQVTSLGSAMCAAVGAGIYADFKDAVEGMRPAPRTLEPSPEVSKEYVRHYERWLSISKWFERLGDDIGWMQ
jgi:sugar (pentulose or hexulose) kinase